MIQSNSKKLESSMHEGPKFYIQKIDNFDSRLKSITGELRKEIIFVSPPDFYEKKIQAKQCDQIDSQWVQNYKQIVAMMIEGKINYPLIRLSQQFRHQFGGQTLFWLDLISSFGVNEKYDQNLKIWQVNDVYKNCLHLHKGEYQKIRKFRRLAKNDIQVTRKLISSINELKMVKQNQAGSKKNIEEILAKVELNYRQHEQSNKKIVQFFKSDEQKHTNLVFFENTQSIYGEKKSQASQVNNSRSKRLSKQKEKQVNVLKQKMITDFSVQMVEDKNSLLLKKIVGNKNQVQIPNEKKNKLEEIFGQLSNKTFDSLENLRNQYKESKQKLYKHQQSFITNVSIAYSYIMYDDFPINGQKFPFKSIDNPFEQNSQINYYNNDYEQYEQYKAQQISDDQIQDSQQDPDDQDLCLSQRVGFYDQQNPYQRDYQDQQIQQKAFRINKQFCSCQWILNYKQKQPLFIDQTKCHAIQKQKKQGQKQQIIQITSQMINNFWKQTTIICLYPTPMPIDIPKQNDLTLIQIQKLKQIFHKRTYQDAMDIINQSQVLSQQFSKIKINTFISKMTKKSTKTIEGKRNVIYLVQSVNGQPNIQNVSQNSSSIQSQSTKANKFKQKQSNFKLDFDQQTNIHQNQNKQQKMQIQFINQRNESQKSSNFNLKKQNDKLITKSQQLSNQSQTNTISNQSKKSYTRKSKRSQIDTDSVCSSLTRLRPRKSKPNYNISDLLKLSKKQRQQDEQVDDDYDREVQI